MTHATQRDFYSVAQAAKILGVSPSTIWRWIEAERLPAYRVGPKNIRIKRGDLEQVVQPAKVGGKEAMMQDVSAIQSGLTVHPLSEEERQRGLQALQQIKQLRARILARRDGKPFPSSWELIREARDERDRQL